MSNEIYTTHKDRSEWYRQRSAYPLRDTIPSKLDDYCRAWEPKDEPKWTCLGPTNIGGRVTALVNLPGKPEALLAGTAGGGVWRSDDAGGSWRSIPWKGRGNVGALAVAFDAAKGQTVILAATGEANLSADSYPGYGLFRSVDGGENFNLVVDANQQPDGTPFPRRIGTIAVDPFDASRMLLGSISHEVEMPAGIYTSADGGDHWRPVPIVGRRSYWCHSIVYHPANRQQVYAALDTNGTQSGIWKSEDGGASWKQLHGGLPSGDEFGRTALAISPSPVRATGRHRIYAFAAGANPGDFLGVFRSDDDGATWRRLALKLRHVDHAAGRKVLKKDRFAFYNNCIAVHPNSPDVVICGGTGLHLSEDGGKTWKRATQFQDRGKPNYVHEDQHALLWPAAGLLYSGNDGGVALTRDGGKTWTDQGAGIVATMFYSLAVAPSDHQRVAGAAQDNGILISGISEDTKPAAGGERRFFKAITGDGAWCTFDPQDPDHAMASVQNVEVFRHKRGQAWDFPNWKPVSPIPSLIQPPAIKGKLPPKIPNPNLREKNQTDTSVMLIEGQVPKGQRGPLIWVATTRLWRTRDFGANWTPRSPKFDGSVVTAVAASPTNPEILFAGTTKGGIFRTHNGGGHWSKNVAGPEIPARLISGLAVHPSDPNVVIAVVAARGLPREAAYSFPAAYAPLAGEASAVPPADAVSVSSGFSHVFRSEDGGSTWQDVDQGFLPDVAFHYVTFEAAPPHRVFVAGDCGVWLWNPGDPVAGKAWWEDLTGTLPIVEVTGLAYHALTKTLTASTYGRGIWRLDVPPAP